LFDSAVVASEVGVVIHAEAFFPLYPSLDKVASKIDQASNSASLDVIEQIASSQDNNRTQKPISLIPKVEIPQHSFQDSLLSSLSEAEKKLRKPTLRAVTEVNRLSSSAVPFTTERNNKPLTKFETLLASRISERRLAIDDYDGNESSSSEWGSF